MKIQVMFIYLFVWFFMLTNRAGKQVASYIHTDVTKYKDLLALFALAEKTFGGVDVMGKNIYNFKTTA